MCRPMRCPPPSRCCPLSARSVWRRIRRHAVLWYRMAPLLPVLHPRPVEEEDGETSRHPAQRESTMQHTTNTRNTTNTTPLGRPSSSLTPQVQLSVSSPSAATQTRRMSTSSPVTPGQQDWIPTSWYIYIFLKNDYTDVNYFPMSPSFPYSTSSKQRKNVVSCVTVHDSPDSDSSNNSPYAVESRTNGPNANNYDSKGTVLDDYNNGNSRTIIIPPLKSQTSESLSECDRLVPGEPAITKMQHTFNISELSVASIARWRYINKIYMIVATQWLRLWLLLWGPWTRPLPSTA